MKIDSPISSYCKLMILESPIMMVVRMILIGLVLFFCDFARSGKFGLI